VKEKLPLSRCNTTSCQVAKVATLQQVELFALTKYK